MKIFFLYIANNWYSFSMKNYIIIYFFYSRGLSTSSKSRMETKQGINMYFVFPVLNNLATGDIYFADIITDAIRNCRCSCIL